MKLFYQVNKLLIVLAALCFIFIVAPGRNLSMPAVSHKVLYYKNDCNGKLLIQEKGRAICIRSKADANSGDEFHPGPIVKMFIE